MARLKQWCEDVNLVSDGVTYEFVFVGQASFEKYQPKSCQDLLDGFIEYQ
jgi:type III restriction enzyme